MPSQPKFDQFWPKLAKVGPTLVKIGRSRANFGQVGQTLPCFGHFSPRSAKSGRCWQNLRNFGPDRHNLARAWPTLGQIWPVEQLWYTAAQVLLRTLGPLLRPGSEQRSPSRGTQAASSDKTEFDACPQQRCAFSSGACTACPSLCPTTSRMRSSAGSTARATALGLGTTSGSCTAPSSTSCGSCCPRRRRPGARHSPRRDAAQKTAVQDALHRPKASANLGKRVEFLPSQTRLKSLKIGRIRAQSGRNRPNLAGSGRSKSSDFGFGG